MIRRDITTSLSTYSMGGSIFHEPNRCKVCLQTLTRRLRPRDALCLSTVRCSFAAHDRKKTPLDLDTFSAMGTCGNDQGEATLSQRCSGALIAGAGLTRGQPRSRSVPAGSDIALLHVDAMLVRGGASVPTL